MSMVKTKAHHSEKAAPTANKSHIQAPHQSTYSLGPEHTPFISPKYAFTSFAGIQMLQRTMGNRAVGRFIQRKLTVGKPGDKYEQEAERVASQVMKMPSPVISRTSKEEKDDTIQTKPIAEQITPLVQCQPGEEEKVQTAPIISRQTEKEEEQVQRTSIIERQEEEKSVQMTPAVPEKEEKLQAASSLQCQQTDEEKVQTLPIIFQKAEEEELVQAFPVIERQEKDEESVQKAPSLSPEKEESVQTSPIIQNQEDEKKGMQKAPAVQFQSEKEDMVSRLPIIQPQGNKDEQIQTDQMAQSASEDKKEIQRSIASLTSINVQRRASADSSGVSQHQEQMIQSSKGSGSPLSPNTRQFFENRFSADFSEVRIHNDSQAANLSQNLNAQAFTVGNDIYFNKGKYDTGTSAGKGLLAHELTHTVQQGASENSAQIQETIQREVATPQSTGSAPVAQQAASPPSRPVAGSAGAGAQSSAPSGQSSGSRPSHSEGTSSVAGAGEISTSGQQPQAASEGSTSSRNASAGNGSTSDGVSAGSQGAPPLASGISDTLLLPEYRSDLTDEEQSRLSEVDDRSATAVTQIDELPSAGETVAEAQAAVAEPQEETASRAQGDIIAALDHREPPSPEIEEICQRIREVIRSKRPPDEDSLIDADPQQMAQEAGNQLDSSIQGETQRMQGEYESVNRSPEGQPTQTPQEPQGQPESVETTDINATTATPDAPGSEDVDLSADVEANRNRMTEAGMDSEPAQIVQDGPIAEARDAQGELEQMAERDPAEVLAETIQARANAAQNMAELQQRAMEALASSRANTVNRRATEIQRTSETEEQIRQRIGNEAQQIVNNTRQQVNSLLEPLSRNAMQRWNTGKEVLATRFSQTLAEVKRWIDERHSGVEGFIVSIGDAIVGLPDWVTQTYDRAEREFGDGVCDLIRDISSEVNGVIASAQALISDSRDRIARLFTDNLPQSLQSWAAEQQAQFEGQLNELHQSTEQTRENLNHQLAEQAAQSVQEARTQIHELRVAAGGIVGRIEDAVNRFLEDPVKFIIDGLLSLAGISPPAFWALINRIQSVIEDIADDPMNFANNLAAALGQGFSQFFDNFGTHILSGFFDWLFSGLGSVGVQLPTDFSLKSIITFCLQLMGITWPNIRRMLVKHIGEQNIALIEQAVQLLSTLIEQGPEGIFEMIKERLDPQTILNQVLEAAVSYLIETLITRVSARIVMMFNPAGAIVQAIEVIYRIISWVFQNAARIFSLVETVVNGAAQLIAGNISGMAGAVEGALARLIAPVIDFLAGFLGLGSLPERIADTIRGFQQMVLGIIERVIDFIATRARSLLRSLGIGGGDGNQQENGNEIDTEVGESVSITAGSEHHTLLFIVRNGNPQLVLRSREALVIDYLNSEQIRNAVEHDNNLSRKVNSARRLAQETDIEGDNVLRLMRGQDIQHARDADNRVELKEQRLASLLTEIISSVGTEEDSIFQILGQNINQIEKAPNGYRLFDRQVAVLNNSFKEISRAAGRGESGGDREYPHVHVEESRSIEAGKGPMQGDWALIEEFLKQVKTLSSSQINGDEAPEILSNAAAFGASLINRTKSRPEFASGVRSQITRMIEVIRAGGNVTGIEVPIGRCRHIDYTIQENVSNNILNIGIEYKHWTGNLSESRRRGLTNRLSNQLTAYINGAQGANLQKLILEWRGWNGLDSVSKGRFSRVINVAIQLAASKGIEFERRFL